MDYSLERPVYVTKPLLPELERVNMKMSEVWESGWITNTGSQHRELEKKLKKYLTVDNISLFNNGTLALLLGIKSLGLKGEVITTPFTFPATVQALDWNGLTPVFCDIESNTLNIDVTKIEELITEKTSAILGVHVFGNPCDVVRIEEIVNKYNIKVIYDGAHSFGTKINGNPISNYGDMTMFSFHATKLFNTIEGGALIVKDQNLLEKLSALKNFGLLGTDNVSFSGLNAKMNEVQAGIGLEVLKIVNEEREKRKNIKQLYDTCFSLIPGIRTVTNLENEESSYQYYVIEIDEELFGRNRDWVFEELKKYNVFTRKYFNPLCSEFPWYKNLKSAQPEHLPVAHSIVKRVLSLPFYGELDLRSVRNICEIFQYFYNSSR
ncbi:DegT/DnrJ/EryC1/StrS aminotransferase family protein [Bacillus sp. AFS040349]|uniref:DegT/DnrJ/EryC1/StrS family aminotransferase n=1 Tax=Bacillus sp. AFS040349 TaxID=2033502 RepID=UPI000BFB6CD3|nr:DegT/DnrJ/EryC1/StrS family aminotransferase [Bacillus sp. AFS040349]PGT81119.1 aminotransferase [Bacillus sp. AFS040349]